MPKNQSKKENNTAVIHTNKLQEIIFNIIDEVEKSIQMNKTIEIEDNDKESEVEMLKLYQLSYNSNIVLMMNIAQKPQSLVL